MTDSAPKQEAPYGLRMPPDLKERVKAAAAGNNRSMNAEIVATLEEKYPAPKGEWSDIPILVDEHNSLAHRLRHSFDQDERTALSIQIEEVMAKINHIIEKHAPSSDD